MDSRPACRLRPPVAARPAATLSPTAAVARSAACIAAAVVGASHPASAIVVGQLDDFQDGTTQGWVDALGGAISPVPPVVVADSGPGGAGDFALQLTSTGAVIGAGSKLVVNNVEPRWQGDYLAAGVDGVMIDVRNPGPTDLLLRVAIDGPAVGASGGRWVSPAVPIPAQSGWQTATFSLAPEDLRPGDFAATDAATTLSNVAVLRLLHATSPAWVGDSIAAQLWIDGVEALPEPAAGAALLAGVLFVRRLGAPRLRS
jgi:hypothetical protein